MNKHQNVLKCKQTLDIITNILKMLQNVLKCKQTCQNDLQPIINFMIGCKSFTLQKISIFIQLFYDFQPIILFMSGHVCLHFKTFWNIFKILHNAKYSGNLFWKLLIKWFKNSTRDLGLNSFNLVGIKELNFFFILS